MNTYEEKKFALDDWARKSEIAVQSGVRAALIRHKDAGNAVCGWDFEKNEVYWVQPEDIEIFPEPELEVEVQEFHPPAEKAA